MARYYRKYRRFPRKYKKTLKKSNIFSKKSAKSQAKQIYALNKKVNYIQKTTKPELQIRNYNIWYKRFLDANSRPKLFESARLFFYEERAMSENTPLYNRIVLQGSMMRVKFIKFFGQFGVYNDTSISGQWNQAADKTLSENDPSTAYLRIIVCRMKKGGGRTPEDILYENPNEGVAGETAYDCSYVINGPLQRDVSGQLDIIKDKKVAVNISHPLRQFTFKLNAKKLGYIYRKHAESSPEVASGENELLIFYYFCCPALLKYTNVGTGTTIPIGPQCYFSLNYNIGYIDQN